MRQQNNPKIITLPKIKDLRGNLSFMEELNQVPFKIARSYWLYDVPGGAERGGHAFKKSCEFFVPLSGSFNVEVTRGEEQTLFYLTRPDEGLFIPNLSWRRITDFTTNAVCLIITSTQYQPDDYIWGFNEYIKLYNHAQC
ncbi:MAG: WxcM-like domain-containing protein [Marinilabiliaceae bacterium]|nr:WxcM-like domain-containing protein [Marinilabiliaceae bacterium]